MKIRITIITCLLFLTAARACALEPDQILVIANSNLEESVRLARYYCKMRQVPLGNILYLPLSASLADTITRTDYEKKLAEPIRQKLSSPEFAGKIRCLLTTYGVPIKVGGRGLLKAREEQLKQLQELIKQEKNKLTQIEQNSPADLVIQKKKINRNLAKLKSLVDPIMGKQTGASVDSELSMAMFGDYELYRWQPNLLRARRFWDSRTLMVSRLDGPGFKIAQRLIDKAIKAEKTKLTGSVYIDSRGIPKDENPYSFGYFDQSLRDLAVITKFQTKIPVQQERTQKLFQPGSCPQTALYCGWYSLKKYIDAFDFVDGAIGYHISSWEAIDLRDPNSTQWCPAMLKDGITATLGAIAEPYLHSFPLPKVFFTELFTGHCLVEAYYYTKPFNSWQMVFIGDPLYRPFRRF